MKTTIELETDQERQIVGRVLGILRAGYDRVEMDVGSVLEPAYRDGNAYPIGVRDMGATLTIRAICDHPRDPQPGERSAT